MLRPFRDQRSIGAVIIQPQFFDLLRRQTIEAVLAQPSPLWDAMGFVVTA